uniref:Uncharacterized protein n=1 Tax=Cacopsylla melanoneura TaxID=428564 RepID=A0A8D9E533_9HEMI
MVISKSNLPIEHLYAGEERLENVSSYTYLGTNINNKVDFYKEIKIRIEKARATFVRMRSFFSSRDLSLELRIRMLKCSSLSCCIMHGMESWTLNKDCEKRLQAFEMWTYRRLRFY